ncbi:MAG: S1C family serine protease [Eubacteriales bacterium]
MPEDKEPMEDFSFLQETIKKDKINGRRFQKNVVVIGILGIVFGITASISFTVVKPWMESVMNPEQKVSIPLDEEPEQVIDVDQMKEEVKEEVMQQMEENQLLEEEQASEEAEEFDLEKMYTQLYEVAQQASQSIVTVSVKEETDEENVVGLEDNSEMQSIGVTGLIVADINSEVLILTPTNILDESLKISVKFYDGYEVEATIKQEYDILGYAILSIEKAALSDVTIQVAELGNSLVVSQGALTIAIGNQFDYEDGLGYGVVSSTKNELSLLDGNYSLISTDIPVAEQGTGILFNSSGQVIGLINTSLTGKTAVEAIGISSLKSIIETMSNGIDVPYIGIKYVEVTDEIAEAQSMPKGLYVQEVEANSPAMEAGIKGGDIITAIDGSTTITSNVYKSKLLKSTQGDIISVQCYRRGPEDYVALEFEVTVGEE